MSVIVQTINDAFNVFSESEFISLIAIFVFWNILYHSVKYFYSYCNIGEEKEEVEL